MNKRWIWEFENYPSFEYDVKNINPLIKDIIFLQGTLSTLCSFASKEKIQEKLAETLTDEIISSSAIEGEFLNRDSVRKSIAKKLGIEEYTNTDYVTDGLVSILIDACTNYNDELDIERLKKWHSAIFPTGRNHEGTKIDVGELRGDNEMTVSGSGPKEIVYYQAPPPDILFDEMVDFFDWFNKTEDGLIKAAIAHLWFLIIHPFDDGNGRIARTISEYVLARVENSYYSKIYSISKTSYERKKDYYEVLEKTTGFRKKDNPLDITLWIEYFLKTLLKSLQESRAGIQYIIEKTKFWDLHKDKDLNARQIKVLNKVLDIGIENYEGGITKSKYVAITKASTSTASNDLKQLLEWNCIKQIEGTSGRGTKYTILLGN
ncbi:cell filamentation protein Fic [Malaciobacter mytili LMG 24559]|uniref:Cell filamentation protein Fic n=1 Tax=Malaciobacter mytili LMG 24559 TaxID=1032238 RepID=A0AAX2ALE5_9BACT|nr:Fic family protein [Malaciobacter mytili]AXH16210.1 Fic family protein (DUF4172 domain) [Malaciobacter mytili LMG 24559]RXK17113.1 cell filamentation protein Fic [Malaciobacter mytili LMG 24559]